MTGLTLVKKTQKEWRCGLCLTVIDTGSMMIRESMNRWQQYQFCLECGKPKVEDALKSSIESFKVFKDYDPSTGVYKMFKSNVEYFEDILKIINEKVKTK